jgi:hypothetical protein
VSGIFFERHDNFSYEADQGLPQECLARHYSGIARGRPSDCGGEEELFVLFVRRDIHWESWCWSSVRQRPIIYYSE